MTESEPHWLLFIGFIICLLALWGGMYMLINDMVLSIVPPAQQLPAKPQIKLSEAKLLIMQTVERMSQAAKGRTGVEFTEEEKIWLADRMFANMRGSYDFVDQP